MRTGNLIELFLNYFFWTIFFELFFGFFFLNFLFWTFFPQFCENSRLRLLFSQKLFAVEIYSNFTNFNWCLPIPVYIRDTPFYDSTLLNDLRFDWDLWLGSRFQFDIVGIWAECTYFYKFYKKNCTFYSITYFIFAKFSSQNNFSNFFPKKIIRELSKGSWEKIV